MVSAKLRLISLIAFAASLPFSEGKGSITITNPNVKDIWQATQQEEVTWTLPSGGYSGSPATLFLGYEDPSDDNRLNVEWTIGDNVDVSRGSVMVTLPSQLPWSAMFRVILVSQNDEFEIASDHFQIDPYQ